MLLLRLSCQSPLFTAGLGCHRSPASGGFVQRRPRMMSVVQIETRGLCRRASADDGGTDASSARRTIMKGFEVLDDADQQCIVTIDMSMLVNTSAETLGIDLAGR